MATEERVVDGYPLQWPAGWPRTRHPERSRFKATKFYQECVSLIHEVELLGGSFAVISTDVELRQDGLPYANRRAPKDQGAAIYFQRGGKQQCLACDQYDSLLDNLHALTKSVHALRGLERWGGSTILDRAFTGFVALPGPEGDNGRTCWEVLGVASTATREELRCARQALAQRFHPDKNGPESSHERMACVNVAYDEAMAQRREGD